MSKLPWLLLGAGAVGVGVVLASRSESGQNAIKGAEATVKRAASKVAKMTVSDKALENIEKYGIWELVTKYAGKVPPPVSMAIIDIESAGTFDPYIYNWTKSAADGGGYGVAYADHGAAPVAKWMKPGDGGFAHDPHAVGLFQILDIWRLRNGKKTGTPNYAGYPLPMLTDMVDPEKNIAAGLKNLNIQWARILKLMPLIIPGTPAFWIALYYTHNQGGGAFEKIASSKSSSVDNLITVPKHLAVAAKVAARVPVWAALQPVVP